MTAKKNNLQEKTISIDIGKNISLQGNLIIPSAAKGLVIFAHGSGSSRFSPRNQKVATALNQINLATLLFDLLTKEEDLVDNITAELRFNIPLLADRLIQVTDWVPLQPETKNLNIGYFGASTGAAAALIAAAERPQLIKAVVSRGGRPDLAGEALTRIGAPTLLIVGGLDHQVIELNQQAQGQMTNENQLVIVEGATHLFEEPGTLEQVVNLASRWFMRYLPYEL